MKVSRRTAARFGRDRRASAAIEFAFLLPLMLVGWAAMSELAHAIDAWRKLTLLSRTVADLTAQGDPQNSNVNPISSATITDLLTKAPALLMRPFDTSKITIILSAMGTVTAKSTTQPWVCSSVANNGTARPAGALASNLTIPAGYGTDGMRYVMAEVSMPYTPIMGSALFNLLKEIRNPISVSAVFPWPIRGGVVYSPNTYKEVILPNSVTSPLTSTGSQKACDGNSGP